MQECINKGMRIGEPAESQPLMADRENMETKFKMAKSCGCEFMLFFHEDGEKFGHSEFLNKLGFLITKVGEFQFFSQLF